MNGSEQGSGALIGVLLLLVMSAVLLHATRRQLDDSLSLVADEVQFIRQFSQAESALSWGMRQDWALPEKGWQCKNEARFGWRACLREVTKARYLLSGDSGAGALTHYRWMSFDNEKKTLTPAPHGWIDFCPLDPAERCNTDD